MESNKVCRENASLEIILFYVSPIVKNITVSKVLELIDGTIIPDFSLIKSWSYAKFYQLPYWNLVAHFVSDTIDSFSKRLMMQA